MVSAEFKMMQHFRPKDPGKMKSWCQSTDFPQVVIHFDVTDAVVQSVYPALPEFKTARVYDKTAPIRRTRNFIVVIILFLNLLHQFFQLLTRTQFPALWRHKGADPTPHRTGSEVGIRL